MARIFDTEGVNNCINQEFNKLRDSLPLTNHQLLILEEARKSLIAKVDSNKRNVYIEGFTKQRFLYFMAGTVVYTDIRLYWFLYHAIGMIIVIEEIDQIIRERYGEEYPEIMYRFERARNILEQIKIDRDSISEKDINEENWQNPAYRRLQNNIAKFSLINTELDHLIVIISLYTSLGKMTIPSQAIQMLQKEYKPVSYQEEKRYMRQNEMGGSE